jgi:hypothetical protein
MVLQQLQDLLAGIYDLPMRLPMCTISCSPSASAAAALRDSNTDEQLLVRDEGGAAAVGLFLDPQLLERLALANPLEALHAGNLADYWTALEGVSHFIYLAWNAGHDRGVSLLELELQAEIDKYVSSCGCCASRIRRAIRPSCIGCCSSVPGRRASGRRALRAVPGGQSICGAFLPPARAAAVDRQAPTRREVLAELRRFYRLSRERKMTHIQRHG